MSGTASKTHIEIRSLRRHAATRHKRPPLREIDFIAEDQALDLVVGWSCGRSVPAFDTPAGLGLEQIALDQFALPITIF